SLLAFAFARRGFVVVGFSAFVLVSLSIFTLVGRDFFPNVDAGLMKLYVRGSSGMRIEENERRFADIESIIREVVPHGEIKTMLDVIGTSYSGFNLSLSEGALISSADGQIFIALGEHHAPTRDYVCRICQTLGE